MSTILHPADLFDMEFVGILLLLGLLLTLVGYIVVSAFSKKKKDRTH